MSSVPPPEDVWLPFIRDFYPERRKQTYFLPPQHFNKVPFSVQTIEGEEAVVYELLPPLPNPGRRGRRGGGGGAPQPPPPGPDPQVAGSVFTRLPAGILPRRMHDSDLHDDRAQETVLRCLRALGDTTRQAMMVISQLEFRHYLDDRKDPVHAAAAALLPNLPAGQRDGECDIIIIHPTHGLVVGEIKSVGGKQFFADSPEVDQDRMIVTQVEKAVNQLNKQAHTLRRLVADLRVKVTKVLLLPNVKADQLMRALTTHAFLGQALCQCLGSADLSDAISRCLCKDNVPCVEDLHVLSSTAHLSRWERLRSAVRRHLPFFRSVSSSVTSRMSDLLSWWRHAVEDAGRDPRMSDDVYDRLLARFCGPATTVDVPTLRQPRKVVRSQGQAVAETGLILSSLALYPQQVDVLSSPNDSVFIRGPPGCGKTLLLFLKGKQWLNQQKDVHVVSLGRNSHAVSLLMYEQLRATLGTAAAASRLHFHHCIMELKHTLDPKVIGDNIASELVALSGGQHLYIITDDFECIVSFTEMCEKLRAQMQGRVTLWAATVRFDKMPDTWITEEILTVPLRCPPTVHREVQKSVRTQNKYSVLSYSHAATEGPTVRWLRHKDEKGHSANDAWDCEKCGHYAVDQLNQLGVGQTGQGNLQWRDVLILMKTPSPSDTFVQTLVARGVPLTVLPLNGASEAALRDFCLGLTDQVTVTDVRVVTGMERRVVIGMCPIGSGRFDAMSRCTAQLIWIGDGGHD